METKSSRRRTSSRKAGWPTVGAVLLYYGGPVIAAAAAITAFFLAFLITTFGVILVAGREPAPDSSAWGPVWVAGLAMATVAFCAASAGAQRLSTHLRNKDRKWPSRRVLTKEQADEVLRQLRSK